MENGLFLMLISLVRINISFYYKDVILQSMDVCRVIIEPFMYLALSLAEGAASS